MEQELKQTEIISPKEYCPSREVPLGIHDILLREVQREDEINHSQDFVIPPLPKYKKEKVENPQWVKNLLKGTLGQLMP